MKKIIFLFLMISFSFASIFDKVLYKTIRKKIAKKSTSIITKTIKHADNSKYIKNLLKKYEIKVVKPIDKIATTATLIAQKGGVVKEITQKYPVKMVYYYSKYGDEFLKITNTMLPKIEKITFPKTLAKKYNLTNLSFLKNQDTLSKRFLDVMKWTGKKGYEITKQLFKYANKHKFAAVAGIAFAWFLADPQGFEEALDRLGGNLDKFLTLIIKTTNDTAVNTVNHSIDVVTSSLSHLITIKNILFIIGVLLLIILWKFKKRIGIVFNKLFNLGFSKIESSLDKKEDEIRKKPEPFKDRSRYE